MRLGRRARTSEEASDEFGSITWPSRFQLGLVLVVAAIAGIAVACGDADTRTATDSSDARCRVDGPKKTTATRAFVLHVLPPERIFTSGQAAELTPKEGEVIFRGALVDEARAGSPSQTHVSVHILDRRRGDAVWEPYPLRVRLGPADGEEVRPLDVALMEGIGEGVCDRHYGTNVRLDAGRRYQLSATLGSETVRFNFEAGAHGGHRG